MAFKAVQESLPMMGFKLSVFCFYVLHVIGPVLANASYFDDTTVKSTLLYNQVGCVLFMHDNSYERLCDDMHLVGQEIYPDPDNLFSVTLFSGFDLNYDNPKQSVIPKWSQYYEWKDLESVSVDEKGCFYHTDDNGKKVKMGSCPMPKYKGGPVPNPYCMRNAGIKRIEVFQKLRSLYPYCALSSVNEGTDTAFANDLNVELSPYPITDDGLFSGATALTFSESMDKGVEWSLGENRDNGKL